jgi:cysteine synthase A
MREGILLTIGNTPLVKLSHILKNAPFQLYAKMEAFNPGGSIKDRAALNILKNGFECGDIRQGTTIIESSSGNMGIGLAQACRYLGLRFICVVDPKTTRQNIEILKAYGADIELVPEPDPVTGEFLQARIDRVKLLCRTIPDSFWPDQYANIYNAQAHHQTMREIVFELGTVDYLFCATSTCGTLRGCADFIREQRLSTKVIAVDALGSVIFGGTPIRRLIPGHGAAIRPSLFQDDMAEKCIHVSDLDCVTGCRRLVKSEAILAGGSSGAVLMAAIQEKDRIPAGSTCVLIFPDRGERYLDTIYSDAWVAKYFGDVSHLWQETMEEEACLTMNY